MFVFDADRKLRYAGRIDDSERPEYVKVNDLRNALDAMVAGKEVEVKTTPAFGCSTKWASKEDSVKKYMENDTIEILPLAYMRGRTLNQSVIILDEGQNATAAQMKMFLTRMG